MKLKIGRITTTILRILRFVQQVQPSFRGNKVARLPVASILRQQSDRADSETRGGKWYVCLRACRCLLKLYNYGVIPG